MSILHLQSKTMTRRRLLHNKKQTRHILHKKRWHKDVYRLQKSRLLNHRFYIYTVKMITIRRILHRKIRKRTFLHSIKLTKYVLDDNKTSFYLHLQSKTMIRRRPSFTWQNSKHDVFYTRKSDIRTFIGYKSRLLNYRLYIYTVKNDDNKTYLS